MRAGSIFVVLVLALALGVAAADPTADSMKAARAHVEVADREYKLGRFDAALVEYTAAYEVYPVPALLFNIAQCHRYLKHYEQALFFYRGFLRDAPANAPNRATVEDLLIQTQTDLDAERVEAAQHKADEEAKRRAAAEDARAHDEALRRADEERRVVEARRQAELDRNRPPPRRKTFYQQWWFWSAVGGAAAIAGGTTLYLVNRTTIIEPTGSLGGLDRR